MQQARPAATIVLVRPGPGGDGGDEVEVVALRRSLASRAAPGFTVFPGGVVEAEDDDLGLAWFGSPEERGRACAVRELAEEAGLLLTSTGVVPVSPGADHLFAAGRDGGFAPPESSALPELARWVAPEFLRMRFDARFYAASAGDPARRLSPTPDGVEITEAAWARPSALLSAFRREELSLAWPTFCTLEASAACRSVSEVLALRIEPSPPPAAFVRLLEPGVTSP